MKKIKRVAVTGGGGQIAYSLLFRIANGDLFGKDQPISLSIHDLEEVCQKELVGLLMELEDGAFPLLSSVQISSDPKVAFKDANIAILVGAKPRGPGMERKDLLLENGHIFKIQGRALNEVAAEDVIVFVVGNPCNTNCLIAMHNAPNIPKNRFHAMTRLDQNRAVSQLAKKANVKVSDIHNLIVFGNHSPTLVLDYYNAKILNKPVTEIVEEKWLEDEFLTAVRQRGALVIKTRGKSSAASATQAIIDAIKDLVTPTPKGSYFSSAMSSDHNPYGIEKDLIFSFPCICKGIGEYEIAQNLKLNSSMMEKIKLSEKELLEEKEAVKHLL